MSCRLQDKVAIITGATSGIGEATARIFAAHGAQLGIAGRSKERGEALVESLTEQYGARFMFHAVDVGREAEMAGMAGSTACLTMPVRASAAQWNLLQRKSSIA